MPDPADPYDLQRFVTAQDQRGAYAEALAQLRRGRKTGHWIWFVLPQLAGLGRSGELDVDRALGPVDAQKLRSCLTLFARARPQQPRFAALLGRWYGGHADATTDRLLGVSAGRRRRAAGSGGRTGPGSAPR